jgi:hypothetical protein
MATPTMLWTGRILSGLFALFILGASAAPKLLRLPVADETMAQLGWPAGYAVIIGVIEATCTVLYLIPRTSVLGAVLMMGILGGAMATQIRAGMPLFGNILFPIYVGLFMWGGLWLRVVLEQLHDLLVARAVVRMLQVDRRWRRRRRGPLRHGAGGTLRLGEPAIHHP